MIYVRNDIFKMYYYIVPDQLFKIFGHGYLVNTLIYYGTVKMKNGIFIDMLIIRTGQPNTLVVTVSQNATISNPEWLFSFTHIFSKEQVQFIPTDISTHKVRYDEFVFVEGSGVGEIQFPYEGLYTYGVYQQTQGSGNLNPQYSQGIIEAGQAQVIVQSANTTNDYYIEYVSNNEYNSNYIFAPNEINP